MAYVDGTLGLGAAIMLSSNVTGELMALVFGIAVEIRVNGTAASNGSALAPGRNYHESRPKRCCCNAHVIRAHFSTAMLK